MAPRDAHSLKEGLDSRGRCFETCSSRAADTAPSGATGSLHAALGASRLQPRAVFPDSPDNKPDLGGSEAPRELRRAAIRVLIQSTREVVAGAGVVLHVLERSVKVQQVDVGHGAQ